MVDAVEVGRRARRYRTVSEKRPIAGLTFEPGASVASVARAHGVNANQVFKWRRAFERGELVETCSALIPVTVSSASDASHEPAQAPPIHRAGAIHIELPGRAMMQWITEPEETE
jgi:transposase